MNVINSRLELIAKAIQLAKTQPEGFKSSDEEFLLIFIEHQIEAIRKGK